MKQRNFLILAMIVVVLVASAFTGAGFLMGQQITATITGGTEQPKIAVVDFRGTGAAQPLMNTFNEVLWNDLADSGFFEMASKTFYPLEVPQRPPDLKPPVNGVRSGPWLTDWSGAPVSANYLAFGYAVAEGADLRVYGYLFNVGQSDVRTAQVIGNPYFASLDEAGARRNAHEFAKDILLQMGVKSLAGSKITFVSDRSGNQEIWNMDYDGASPRQITSYKSISKMPAVSTDGKRVALITLAPNQQTWQVRVHSTETSSRYPFVSPSSSYLATPEFTPDGKQVWFSAALNDRQQLMRSNIDGGNLTPVLGRDETIVSARINPKNADEVVFISGRSGVPQLYKMNANGTGQQLLTDGTGDVANPSWSPDGQKVAFAWTRGYAPGNFNIFIMDMASKRPPVQLTKENGSNENPWWAPDGAHLVYSNTRTGKTQLYTMLANGTRVKQLTSQGNNRQPVWSKAIE